MLYICTHNVGLFEELEPSLLPQSSSVDGVVATIPSPQQLTPPLHQSVATPSSSCFHHDLPTEGPSSAVLPSIATAVVTNANEQHWELEQVTELDKCSKFVVDTCGCKWANGKPCSTLFTEEYYVTFRAQASFLTHEQLDLVLLGSVMSTVSDGDVVAGRHKPAKRQRTALTYMHKGHHLCRSTFNFLYGVGKHRVPAIKNNFLEYGLETRVHGNSRIRPHNALSWDMVMNIVKFICNYAEQNAILLPGRIPTHKRDDIKLLPSSDSKKVQNTHTI